MDDAGDRVDGLRSVHSDAAPRTPALIANVRRPHRPRAIAVVAAYAGLLTMVVLFLFPLLWIVGLSLKTRSQIFTTPPLFMWQPTLENYSMVLARTDFVRAFVNSLLTSSGAVLLALCAGVPSAYVFARFPFRGHSILFFSLLVMRMLPPIVVLLPMFVMLNRLGLTNTRTAVILAYTTFSLPLVTWIMRGFFADLPQDTRKHGFGGMGHAGHIVPVGAPGASGVALVVHVGAAQAYCASLIGAGEQIQRGPIKTVVGAGH